MNLNKLNIIMKYKDQIQSVYFLVVLQLFCSPIYSQIEVGPANNVGIRQPEDSTTTISIINDRDSGLGNSFNMKSYHNIHKLNSMQNDSFANSSFITNSYISPGLNYLYNLDCQLYDTINKGDNFRYGIHNSNSITEKSSINFFWNEKLFGINNSVSYKNSPAKSRLLGLIIGSSTSYGIRSYLNLNQGYADRYGIYNEVTHSFGESPPVVTDILQYGIYNYLKALPKGFDTTEFAPIALYSKIDMPTGEGSNRKYAGYFVGDVKIENSLFVDNIFLISDRNLKKNINPLNDAMSIINQLNPVSFNFKDLVNYPNLPKRIQFGLIAQDVEKIVPELVNETVVVSGLQEVDVFNDKNEVIGKTKDRLPDKTYKAVNYDQLVPFLIKAIQEQQVQIDSLKADIEILKNK